MTEELGRIEKPEAQQFRGKRKLYLVPLLFSWKDTPQEYSDMLTLYWQQVREHVASLESRVGSVNLVYHESVVASGEEGLKILETLNPPSHQLVREKCLMGAFLEVVEDRELLEETSDWERHLIMGFLSDKVAMVVSQFFADASKRRYEYISRRIEETLKENSVAMLIIRERHMVQFPKEIEVFSVAPPVLNSIRRWLQDRQSKDEQSQTEQENTNQDTSRSEQP